MKKIIFGLLLLWMLVCTANFSEARVSIGIGLPNVNIGINLPLFPHLVPVPGYPVYYDPGAEANYFFYDGMYWVFHNDNWYASTWYNGPWGFVEPEAVPLFVLRVPVRYYRQPPVYFRGWQSNAPPRWGQHWGRDWEHQRRGWDRWDRSAVPRRAPVPTYQRQYSGDRYPHFEEQRSLREQSYRYQPRDRAIRQHYRQQETGRSSAEPVHRVRQNEQRMRTPSNQGAPVEQRPQPQMRGNDNLPRSAPDNTPPQQRGPAVQEQRQQSEVPHREQRGPRSHDRQPRQDDKDDKNDSQDSGRGNNREDGRGRNK